MGSSCGCGLLPPSMPDMSGDATTGAGTSSRGADPTAALTIGSRVVVRYRLPESADFGATDVVGVLLARNADVLIVETPTGKVKLTRSEVIVAKDVPPAADRRGRPHQRISPDDLQRTMSEGWVATDRAELGDWKLRAASGFTGRANSVLPVGDPSLPLHNAITFAQKWYADRGQRALFQIYGATGFQVEEHPVGSALTGRGYLVGGGRPDWSRVLVMTATSAAIPPLTADSVPVIGDAKLQPDWVLAYGEGHSVQPGVTESVLTSSAGQLFMSVRDEASGRPVAIARMAIHPGWAGIYGLWVAPERRRTGLATAVVAAIAMAARENTMGSLYLQVSADNEAGIAFWQGLDFAVHHEYTYLSQPSD